MALFAATQQLSESEQRALAKEAHAEAAKAFRIAADAALRAKAVWQHTESPLSNAPGREVVEARRHLFAALDVLIACPAVTKSLASEKKRIIGRFWLRAEGERFDRYREAVTNDARRLSLGTSYADRRMSGASK
ncbi:MAG: hypothetical protein A2885_13545 [Sphingopyxis sp. RIFCSPHIGHO2_01_FULL_65_24]|nr:MAG: hypothetical protein A2885_13545 [Sphingopyxis sp. RIFCSPHIGHO2_01_FULL_65_24]